MQPMQGRSPIINVTSNACILAGKKILKDFLEIENLQVSKKDTSKFISKTLIILENFNNMSFEFNESQNLKNTSDVFQQKNYENSIKRNFAFSIIRKFNLSLVDLKWF